MASTEKVRAGGRVGGRPGSIRKSAAAAWGATRAAMQKWGEWLGVALAILFVIGFLQWTVALNDGFDDWGDADYYKLQVRGWRQGHLHLAKAPLPELLALADPYDPAQNAPYRLGDASLYKGKYYIYFGPAPALTVMLPVTLLTGREMGMGEAIGVFCSLAFLAGSGLWLAVRRCYFPKSAGLLAPLGVLAIGFGTHLPALAQRPQIWELPIAAGVAFGLMAAGAIFGALQGFRPRLTMALAGLCLGLAVGSRPTWLLAVPALLVPLWQARRLGPPGRWRELALAAALPLGVCGLALMAHNYARFDDPWEWGQNHQLSGAYEGRLTHFSLRFLAHNFGVYFFQPLRWTWEFPFTQAVGIPVGDIAGYFGTEEVAGLAVTFVFFWFVLALPLAWWRRATSESARLGATLAAIAAVNLPVMALVMAYFSTTTRYQTDFAVGFAVLALTGMLAVERRARSGGRWLAWGVRGAAGMICALAVPAGILLSFDYHERLLRATGPARWRELDQAAQDVIATAGWWLGRLEGPRVFKVVFQSRPAGTVETFWQSADPGAAERILVRHEGGRLIRFGFARGAGAVTWGWPIRWEKGHLHTVSAQAPSLYPPPRDDAWARLLRREEFRQRTVAAVWFSGGPALGVVVPTLPPAVRPGGAIGADFSGEVRRETRRRLRPDEITGGLADPGAPRGGILRMRVVFPERPRDRGEPVFVAGAHDRSTMVYVKPDAGGLRFVFENYPRPRIESERFSPNPAGHVLELEMPSFRPAAFGTEAAGEVIVRLDGKELLRSRQTAYAFVPGTEKIGENPFGTTCELEFGGWLYDAQWAR